MTQSPQLCIDFGTSHTVGALRFTDGRIAVVMPEGTSIMPSAVALDNGQLIAGRSVPAIMRIKPSYCEPHPKQHMSENELLLGQEEVLMVDAVAVVLRRILTEASRMAGLPKGMYLTDVTLTHPEAWRTAKRRRLVQAAQAAGITSPVLMSEPLAAAQYLATHKADLTPGNLLVVYDLGGGTFDVTVVRVQADGNFEVLAADGLPDAGGVDIDNAIVTGLGETFATLKPDDWRRLVNPHSVEERRNAVILRDNVRFAKEELTTGSQAFIDVPGVRDMVPLGRETLDKWARPLIERTIICTRTALQAAGVNAGELTALVLVGGATRMPLVATILHQAFGMPPTTFGSPETIVAEGGVSKPRGSWRQLPTRVLVSLPAVDDDDESGVTQQLVDDVDDAVVSHPRRPRVRVALAAVLAVVLLAVVIVFATQEKPTPPVAAPDLLTLAGHSNTVAAAFTYDNRRAATLSSDGYVRMADATSGETIWKSEKIEGARHFVISAGDEYLYVSGENGVHVLVGATGKPLKQMFSEPAGKIAICASQNVLAVAQGLTVQMYNAATYEWQSSNKPEIGNTPVVALACQQKLGESPLIAASSGSGVAVWPLRSSTARPRLSTPTGKVVDLTFGGEGDEDTVYGVTDSYAAFKRLSSVSATSASDLSLSAGFVPSCLTSHPDADYVVICHGPTIRVIHKATFREVASPTLRFTFHGLALSRDGNRVVVGYDNAGFAEIHRLAG